MRRENRRNLGKEGLETKKVLYISGSILAIAIIGFVITFFIYGNKLEQDTTLGKLNTNIMDSYGENTEAASLEFGKTVNEMENEITNDVADTTKYAIIYRKVLEYIKNSVKSIHISIYVAKND